MNQRKKKEGERERFRGRERGWERERRCASAAKRRTEEEKGWKMGRLLYTDELCEYVNARTHLQFDGSPSLPPFSSKTPALSLSERPCLRVLENWTRACVCECYVNSMLWSCRVWSLRIIIRSNVCAQLGYMRNSVVCWIERATMNLGTRLFEYWKGRFFFRGFRWI